MSQIGEVSQDNSDAVCAAFGFAFLFFMACALFFAMLFGAMDMSSTWTASDMRGEVQRRLELLDEREAKADTEWELLKIQAERKELLAITEPYE